VIDYIEYYSEKNVANYLNAYSGLCDRSSNVEGRKTDKKMLK